MAEQRQPWMKFYPGDWRAEPSLKMCSRAARSFWIDLLCLMHESDPYGYLLVKGKAPTLGQLSELVGSTKAEIDRWRQELQANGVFSRVGDIDLDDKLKPLVDPDVAAGTIFSRRMVRDAAKAATNKANGKGGGNPNITRNVKRGVNPQDKAQSPEARVQTSDELRNSSGATAPPLANHGEPAKPLWAIIPPDGDYCWALFNPGLGYLAAIYGEKPGKLRGMIGQWLKIARGVAKPAATPPDHRRVWDLLVRCQAEGIADPKAWMVAHLGGKTDDGAAGPSAPRETTVGMGETAFQRALREWRDGGEIGPMPTAESAK